MIKYHLRSTWFNIFLQKYIINIRVMCAHWVKLPQLSSTLLSVILNVPKIEKSDVTHCNLTSQYFNFKISVFTVCNPNRILF